MSVRVVSLLIGGGLRSRPLLHLVTWRLSHRSAGASSRIPNVVILLRWQAASRLSNDVFTLFTLLVVRMSPTGCSVVGSIR